MLFSWCIFLLLSLLRTAQILTFYHETMPLYFTHPKGEFRDCAWTRRRDEKETATCHHQNHPIQATPSRGKPKMKLNTDRDRQTHAHTQKQYPNTIKGKPQNSNNYTNKTNNNYNNNNLTLKLPRDPSLVSFQPLRRVKCHAVPASGTGRDPAGRTTRRRRLN